MKFTVDTKVLSESLSKIFKAVSSKEDIENHSQYINIEAKKSDITLTAFNGGEFRMRTIISNADFFKVETEGSYAAPGKQLHSLISSYPAGQVLIEFEANKNADSDSLGKLQFYSGGQKNKKSRHSLVGESVSWSHDFNVKGTEISIDPVVFVKAVSRTYFAASSEQFRGTMQALRMEFYPAGYTTTDKDGVVTSYQSTFVATDGRIMAHQSLPEVTSPAKAEAMIPAGVMRHFTRAVEGNPQAMVNMVITKDKILLSQNVLYGKFEALINGYSDAYPPYKKVIDKPRDKASFNIETANLSKILERVSAINPEDSTFLAEGDKLKISADERVGDYEEECIISNFVGQPTSVVLTLQFVKQMINTAEGGTVKVNLGENNIPVQFKIDDDYSFYIMPLDDKTAKTV